MYAAPVQVNVQARKLIDSFERGEVTRETEEDEEEGQKLAYPEMSSRELALPGTARKRMMELEKLKREAEERVREKPALSTRKLSEVTRETEEDEEDGQKAAYPEMSSRELALPGTAKKRLMELERLKKEAEEREKEKTTTSTKKLSEQMYGDFAHDRMKVGSGVSRANYGSKDGLEHPRVKGESAKEHREVFTHGDRNRHEDRSHHEERHQVSKHEERGDHKEHREVFSHEERSHLDGADRGGKTRVLVVTSSGTGAESVLDKELVDNVVRILKDEDHEVDVTDLSHTRGTSPPPPSPPQTPPPPPPLHSLDLHTLPLFFLFFLPSPPSSPPGSFLLHPPSLCLLFVLPYVFLLAKIRLTIGQIEHIHTSWFFFPSLSSLSFFSLLVVFIVFNHCEARLSARIFQFQRPPREREGFEVRKDEERSPEKMVRRTAERSLFHKEGLVHTRDPTRVTESSSRSEVRRGKVA